jgi:hypothetical protein
MVSVQAHFTHRAAERVAHLQTSRHYSKRYIHISLKYDVKIFCCKSFPPKNARRPRNIFEGTSVTIVENSTTDIVIGYFNQFCMLSSDLSRPIFQAISHE